MRPDEGQIELKLEYYLCAAPHYGQHSSLDPYAVELR